MYNRITITQLGTYKVKIELNNKIKVFTFFVVPGNRQALLGMPDIEIQNILNMTCNAIGTNKTDRDANYNSNTAITQGTGSE